MAWQAIVMYAVVAGAGIPAAFRNITALVMVIAWLSVELVYQITGDSLPLKFSFMADISVISVIYAKTIRRCGAKIYSSLGEQLRCLITDLTPGDRGIVIIYIFGCWPAYALVFDPWWKWMLLWALTIVQFLFAGGEFIASFLEARHKIKKSTSIIDRHLVVIPFPLQRRDADATFEPPVCSDSPSDTLVAYEGRGYG